MAKKSKSKESVQESVENVTEIQEELNVADESVSEFSVPKEGAVESADSDDAAYIGTVTVKEEQPAEDEKPAEEPEKEETVMDIYDDFKSNEKEDFIGDTIKDADPEKMADAIDAEIEKVEKTEAKIQERVCKVSTGIKSHDAERMKKLFKGHNFTDFWGGIKYS